VLINLFSIPGLGVKLRRRATWEARGYSVLDLLFDHVGDGE
jgi:hypothetical protein